MEHTTNDLRVDIWAFVNFSVTHICIQHPYISYGLNSRLVSSLGWG